MACVWLHPVANGPRPALFRAPFSAHHPYSQATAWGPRAAATSKLPATSTTGNARDHDRNPRCRRRRCPARSRGHGKALLDWLKGEARRLGCVRLQLDSGTFRKDAHAFYLREGLRIEAFHLGIALD